MLVRRLTRKQSPYEYISDQLKAIRQDLMVDFFFCSLSRAISILIIFLVKVQNIDNDFVVEVYEFNAKVFVELVCQYI